MTDSADRKPGTKLTPEQKLKLQSLQDKKLSDRTELSDLPRWAKTAMVRLEVYGESYQEVAKQFGKAASTLASYAKCPAGKKWREQLRTFVDDPIEIAKAYLKGNALNLSLDRIAHLEQAQKAGDYTVADKIASDLMDRLPGLGKQSPSKGGSSPTLIQITLPGGATTEPIMVESEVQEAEYEVDG